MPALSFVRGAHDLPRDDDTSRAGGLGATTVLMSCCEVQGSDRRHARHFVRPSAPAAPSTPAAPVVAPSPILPHRAARPTLSFPGHSHGLHPSTSKGSDHTSVAALSFSLFPTSPRHPAIPPPTPRPDQRDRELADTRNATRTSPIRTARDQSPTEIPLQTSLRHRRKELGPT